MEKKIRVLLADDEQRLAKNLSRLLETRGFSVTVVFDGVQAVNAVELSDMIFHVAVLDIMMPGLDGIAVLERIKELSPDTEVIMLTGQATLDTGISAMRKGAYDYLMKPCDIEDLAAKIREAHEVEVIKGSPVLWHRKFVEEIIIYNFEKIDPKDPVVRALEVLGGNNPENGVDTVYVVDSKSVLCGVVTRRDLLCAARSDSTNGPSLKWDDLKSGRPIEIVAPDTDEVLSWSLLAGNPNWLPVRPISRLMHAPALRVKPKDLLTDCARRMIMRNVRCAPVVEDGKILGIVRMQDIFQYVKPGGE